MFAIVIAHTPTNPWASWIPARFGFSDATEIFVFCSGMASALAFGTTFASHGWLMGTARTVQRVWQVYWAHIGTFLVIAAGLAWINTFELTASDYVGNLNLYPFFDDPVVALPALLSLGYVPNYFDILPMYLVILAMMPVAMALARIHLGLVMAASLTLWLAANLGHLRLSAAPWNELRWYFNPFAWQLVFFTGFALMAGWVRPPPVRRDLIWLAAAIVLLTIPFAWFRLLDAFPVLRQGNLALVPLTGKTQFGVLRYVHFLALAYLAWVAVGPKGVRLSQGRFLPVVTGIVCRVGQQSLAVFMFGMGLSLILGLMMDLFGRSPLMAAIANLSGMALVVGAAFTVAWFKSQPWRRAAKAPRVTTADPERQALPQPSGAGR